MPNHLKQRRFICFFLFGALSLLAACSSNPRTHTNWDSGPARLDPDFPPNVIELNFDSYDHRLNGHLYLANGQGPHPTVVLLHGYPGNEKNLDTAQVLRRNGFNVLFFHYRGAWGSAGTYRLRHVFEDVGSALGMLRQRADAYRVDPTRLILLGHSLGGFAALQAAARDQAVQCVASMAAADLGVWASDFAADAQVANDFKEYSDGLDMLANFDGTAALSEIHSNAAQFSLLGLAPKLAGKSVLLLAGVDDDVVPVASHHHPMVAAYRTIPDIKLTDIVISGDHSFSWSRHELNSAVLEWAKTCR